jgi:hypothetical protein
MTKKQADVIQDVAEMNVGEVMSVYEEKGEPVGIPGLTAGRIVHYVLSPEKHRPAIITNVLDNARGCVNLCVFMDGEIDGFAKDNCPQWIEGVPLNESATTDTWHWMD